MTNLKKWTNTYIKFEIEKGHNDRLNWDLNYRISWIIMYQHKGKLGLKKEKFLDTYNMPTIKRYEKPIAIRSLISLYDMYSSYIIFIWNHYMIYTHIFIWVILLLF